MPKNNKSNESVPTLLGELMQLLQAHRSAFRQERTFQRSRALVFGELFAFARHTVTQGLMALGLTDSDWSGWYRLFSRKRFDEEKLASCLFTQTLPHVPPEKPYVIGLDSTQIPRSSRKMPGTSWLRAIKTAPFKRGIHRAQRFEHGAWLAPIEEGYSRAIPLRFLPAFPPKAVASEHSPCKEWEAGLTFLNWVRQRLDEARRSGQDLLVLGDGAYDNVDFWRELPDSAIAMVRTARNRKLRKLPGPYSGRGRKLKYGAPVPHPEEWLQVNDGWEKMMVHVRGRQLEMKYRVAGPYLRERAGERPMWLVVVKGNTWKAGKTEPRRTKYRKPAFYLVSVSTPA